MIALKVLTVCLCLYFAIVVGENGTSIKYNQTIPSNIEKCTAEYNVTSDEFCKKQLAGELPENKSNCPNSCKFYCKLKNKNLIVNGNLSMENIQLYLKDSLKPNRIIMSLMQYTAKSCYEKAVLKTDKCEMSETYERCLDDFNFNFNNDWNRMFFTCADEKNLDGGVAYMIEHVIEKPNLFTCSHKCMFGCLFRLIGWINNGKFELNDNTFFYETQHSIIYKQISDICSKRVESVTDECELGFLIMSCWVEAYTKTQHELQKNSTEQNNVPNLGVDWFKLQKSL